MNLRLVALTLSCLALTGCGTVDRFTTSPAREAPSPRTSGTPVTARGELLASYTRTGGMCVNSCDVGIKVYTDGTYRASGAGQRVRGQFPDSTVRTLTGTLEAADLLANPKPERLCMSWVDGQDTTVTYHVPGGQIVTASTCDYDFTDDPAVSALTHLQATAITEGTPPDTAPAS